MKISEFDIEYAIDAIDREIASNIKNNKEKDFFIFKEKIKKLADEKEKIYNLDEEIIKKYLMKVKN